MAVMAMAVTVMAWEWGMVLMVITTPGRLIRTGIVITPGTVITTPIAPALS